MRELKQNVPFKEKCCRPYQQDSRWNCGVTPAQNSMIPPKKRLMCLFCKSTRVPPYKELEKILVEALVDSKRKMTSRTRRLWWWRTWWTIGVEKKWPPPKFCWWSCWWSIGVIILLFLKWQVCCGGVKSGLKVEKIVFIV